MKILKHRLELGDLYKDLPMDTHTERIPYSNKYLTTVTYRSGDEYQFSEIDISATALNTLKDKIGEDG